MDYKEKYNKLVEAVKVLQKTNPSDEGIQNWINDNVPELRESEDEQIIKALAEGIRAIERCGWSDFGGIPIEDVLDWLEKQGQVKESSIPQHENKTCEENSNSLTSEDERIRKSLITFFQRFPYDSIEKAGTSAKDAIAWLEKQCKPIDEEKVLIGARKGVALSIINYLDNNSVGMCLSSIECEDIEDACVNSKWIKLYNYMKKKLEKQGSPVLSNSSNVVKDVECSADRIVPKFKVGDWVVFANGNVERITNVGTHGYTFDDGDYLLHENCDKQAHLWSIADAKDGDVLVVPLPKEYEAGEQIFIFKGINNRDYVDNCIEYYCRICQGVFYENKNGYMGTTSGTFYPATKEQRDTLMKAMRDAGYSFDLEKKELKKIEHDVQLTEFEEAVKDLMNDYRDAIGDNDATIEEVKEHAAYMLSLIHQNFAWSEEDESYLNTTIAYLKDAKEFKKNAENCINWLKSIKDKVQPQPKQEWCEEDEKVLKATINTVLISRNSCEEDDEVKDRYDDELSWLKSLKQRLGGEKWN